MKSIDKISKRMRAMKISTVLLLLLIISSACDAQTLSQVKESHKKIKSFVASKYPEAKSVSILDECWGYRTTFKTQEGKCVSSFSLKNDWIQTERKIALSDLPESVKQRLNTKYNGAKVLTVKEIMLPQQPSPVYLLEVRNTLRNDNMSDNYGLAIIKDYKLYYTANGQLTKEEEQPGAIQGLPWGED